MPSPDLFAVEGYYYWSYLRHEFNWFGSDHGESSSLQAEASAQTPVVRDADGWQNQFNVKNTHRLD